MPFSASTCLSYTGTTTLINPLILYSDSDDYISSFGFLSLSAITGDNCPCIINNIPDNTKKIKIVSKNNYCVFIDILCNQICDICDLGFTANTNTVGKITIGNLTGSCQSNISDYLINWYGPDSLTNIAFTSGKGTKYNYLYEQPFSDLIQFGGVYRPKLQKIILSGITPSSTSGITFSSTGGTGQVLADLNCLPNVTVQDFNCSNGNSSATYSHSMEFKSTSNKEKPRELKAKFLLTGTTKYFALSFNCYTQPDTIKIIYSGINYSEPIVLQDMILATTTDVNPTTIPRKISEQLYTNVLCLTGLSMTTNDFLIINVIPNTSVNDTNWNLSLKCLGDIDTTLNGYEIFKNQSYKLSASTISYNIGSCNSVSVTAKMIGIQSGSNVVLSDYLKYNSNQTGALSNVNTSLIYPSGKTQCSYDNTYIPNMDTACTTSGIDGDIVNFKRVYSATLSAATYNMEFSTYSAFTDSYNSLLAAIKYSGSTDPTKADKTYYTRVRLRHYYGKYQTTTCLSDNSLNSEYYVHPATLVVTTGITTGGLYNLQFIQPVLPPAYQFNNEYTNCDYNCQYYLNTSINNINDSTTATTPTNITNTVGTRAKTPFFQYARLSKTIYDKTTYSNLANAYQYYNSYGNLMIPYSANSTTGVKTIIPSLSSVTSNSIYNLPYADKLRNIQRLGYFDVYLLNPLNNYKDFEIYARPIVNYNLGTAPGVLVYRYSGGTGTVIDSTYII